jgi:hypothetical protein
MALRRWRLALLSFTLLALPATASAGSLPLEPPQAGTLPLRPFAGPLQDAIIHAGATSASIGRASVASTAADEHAYRTRDGYAVRVAVSPAFALDPARVQAFVDFLDTRLHGPELGRLHIRLSTQPEIESTCGAEALACYDPARERMYIPGEQTSAGQPSLEHVVTHEYGHHVALNRSNAPWWAEAWGPKRWASAERVCHGVFDGRLFPGDEDRHYFENPGEAWAESYATYHYRASDWRWTPLLRPGDPAFGAIRRDVVAPWRGQSRRSWTIRFSARRSRVARVSLTTRLDGVLSVAVRPARGETVVTQVVMDGRRISSTADHTVRGELCGQRSVSLRLVRRRGLGTVRVAVSYPG